MEPEVLGQSAGRAADGRGVRPSGQPVREGADNDVARLLGGGAFFHQQGGRLMAGPTEALQDDLVVMKAAILFLQHGISNVRMTDIAKEAGVGVATLYRHFSTKSRIVVQVAILLWRSFNVRIHQLVESDDFMGLSGAQRLERLLREYASHYASNRAFVSFLDEFDHLVLADLAQQEITPEDLAGYGDQVDSFYLIFEDAYRLGLQDGSVARQVDFRTFYRAVAHALLGVAEKLGRGEVIPSDDDTHDWEELDCIVEMAVRSLTCGGLRSQTASGRGSS